MLASVLVALLVLGASAVAGAAVLRDSVGTSGAALAASCGTDEFDGTALDDERWDVLRPAEGLSVADGKLNLQLRNGDLITGTASAENVVLQDAPAGGWTATTEFNIAQIDAQGEQAGIVLWQGENPNSFGKIMFIQTQDANTRVIESIWTDRGALAVPINDSRAPVPALPADADVLMRLRSDGSVLTAEFSTDDGATWTKAGQSARYTGALRVGLVAIQGSNGNGGLVPFERFDLECAPQLTADASSGAAPLEVDFTSSGSPAGATVTWDFGDGTAPVSGGDQQTHTFAQPGVYRVRQTAVFDEGRRTLTGSTVFTVDPAEPLDPPQSDEFAGNELDPKWEVLRPRETGVTVSDGHVRLQAYGGDMHGTTASARNVLLQQAPTCAFTAETQIDLRQLTSTGDQTGLVLWRSESPNNFAKVVYNRRGGDTWWVERSNTVNGGASGTSNTAAPNPPASIRLRVVVAEDGNVQPQRFDGTDWVDVGAPFVVGGSGPLKVGLTYFSGNALRTSGFDYFRVDAADPCDPPPECPELEDPEEGFTRLWDGSTLDGWRQAGPGSFAIDNDPEEGCSLRSVGGLGLLWHDRAQYDEFVLRMQWRTEDDNDNSGVFVRFPDPGNDPGVAIDEGHEIQIREGTQGETQKTGSIYNFAPIGLSGHANPAGEWNDYEIHFEDDTYKITLNGELIQDWENTSDQGRLPGYIGLQNHGTEDSVWFRDIRIQTLGEPVQPNLFTTIGITRSETRANSQIHGTPTRYSLPAEEMPPSGTVGTGPDDDFDDVRFRMPDTSGTVPNLAAFRGQTLDLRAVDQKQYAKIHFFGTTTDGGPAGGDFVLRFSDGTTQAINVRFRDWCAPQDTAAHHVAIGPLSQRYRESGGDGAQCAIFHVPGDVTAGKTLESVTLPPDTTPAGTNTQAYLMALTLEDASGAFVYPDLSGQLEFPDDLTPPVTEHTVDPAAPGGENGWYTEAPTVTLTAGDETGGSGVREIQYRINGGAPQAYDEEEGIVVDREGDLTVEYRSIDNAGNAEDYKPVELKVDGTAPVTSAAFDPDSPRGNGEWDDTPVTVTLTGRDGEGSGVATTQVHFGDGQWATHSGPLTVSQDGVHQLHFRSLDTAGNVEDEQMVELQVDDTAPASTATLTSAAPGANNVHRAPVTVTLASADGTGSGVAGSEYRLDNGAWQAYSGAFTVSAVGGHILEYRARDVAGNLENAKELTFAITTTQGGAGSNENPVLPPEPFVGLMPVDRVSIGKLQRGRLSVRAACVSVGRGTLSLKVSRKVARRLGLGRRTTLAKRSVRCGDESRITVRLDPSRKVERALRRARGSFAATLRLRMVGVDGPASDSERLVLRRR